MSRCGKFILKTAGLYCCAMLVALFFTFVLTQKANAQANATPDSSRVTAFDLKRNDSLAGVSTPKDSATLAGDTSARSALEAKLGIRISKDALPDVVHATAIDSAVIGIATNLFQLYGDANLKYQETELNAGKVTYNQNTNLITAIPLYDSIQADTAKVKPSFKQGTEKFTFDKLEYNFKSKRAIVRNARTQYGEGFVHSEQIKRNPDESIYGYKSAYTTCSLDTPHFSIRTKHMKMIPDRIIVSGAANLVIEGVPTPLYLPFGIFPITQSQRSGFQLPSYTLEERRGLGLTNLGYYFYLNDYVDLLVLTNIFSKGSYNVSLVSKYSDRYHYTGGLSFNYGYEKTGEDYEPNSIIQKSFALQWQHSTDPKARPGRTFNASVNIQKGNYYSRNSYNPNEIVQNIFSSNITYSKNWQGKPYSLTIAALHDQNTQTHQMNITLPSIAFYISQITPFQRKNPIGSPRWYEKITTSYSLSALAKTSFYDTAFRLNTLSLSDFRKGMKHSIPVSASYTVLRFVNLSFGVNYNEYWMDQQLYQYYNNNLGKIDTVLNQGFYSARDASATMQLSTRIYGLKTFKSGKIAGIRHVLTPSLGLNYTPDYAAAPFRYYYQTTTDASGYLQYRSPYEQSVVGEPGLGQHGFYASTINYGLNNNLQMKVRTKKDTANNTKNITLIDALSIAGNYNFAADSFKWSPVNLSFRTNILNMINISAGANFDPYKFDYQDGRRVDVLGIGNGGFVRFNDANISLASSFHSKKKGSGGADSKVKKTDEYTRLMSHNGYNDYIDFNIPWSLNVSYALTASKLYRPTSIGKDTVRFTENSIRLSGDFNLTPKWKVTFSSGYDVANKALTITSIDIYRDLHCWEMRLGTIPFGPNKSYNFTLNVKASVLQDLRLLRRRDYRDAVGY